MTATCDTCPNHSNLPLVVWAGGWLCLDCAGVPNREHETMYSALDQQVPEPPRNKAAT